MHPQEGLEHQDQPNQAKSGMDQHGRKSAPGNGNVTKGKSPKVIRDEPGSQYKKHFRAECIYGGAQMFLWKELLKGNDYPTLSQFLEGIEDVWHEPTVFEPPITEEEWARVLPRARKQMIKDYGEPKRNTETGDTAPAPNGDEDEESSSSHKGRKRKRGKKSEKEKAPPRFASLVTRDGWIVETLHAPGEQWPLKHKMVHKGPREFGSDFKVERTIFETPISNGLVEKGTILLPSDVSPYGSQTQLVVDIERFIHLYADIPEFWEKLIAHFVLMTWVYDRFSALPYLRFLSESGTGKSRLLQICGHLAYKGILASGAITASPLFRLMDVWGGTLVIDEADFKDSEAWSDIVKVLNTGYMRGVPVIRSEKVGQTYEPRAFDTFGPKVIGNRSRFGDPALEGRCLTLEGEERRLREDIPRQLPSQFFTQAEKLRNALLGWRFDKLDDIQVDESQLLHLEPRLTQIGTPIYSVSDDPVFRSQFLNFLAERGAEERSERPQAVVVEAIKALVDEETSMKGCSGGGDRSFTVKRVADRSNKIIQETGAGEEMTAKRVGRIVRSLGFRPERKERGFTFRVDAKRLAEVGEKYLPKPREADGSKTAERGLKAERLNVTPVSGKGTSELS